MATSEIAPWLPSIATLVGLLALYHVHRLNNRRAAAGKFRAAFSQALGRLEAGARHGSTHDQPDVDTLLRQQLEMHAGAVAEFRPFVPPARRVAFDAAWNRYCEIVAGASATPLFMAEYENPANPWSVLTARIEGVLGFAHYT